jgi:SH3-like domain-containing protein
LIISCASVEEIVEIADALATGEPIGTLVPGIDPGVETSPPTPSLPQYYACTDGENRARLRSCASLSCEVVAMIAPGEQVSLIAERGSWLQIALADGTSGFVYSTLFCPVGIVAEPEVTPTLAPTRVCRSVCTSDGQRARVRSCPGMDCAVLLSVPPGDIIEVLATEGEWVHVQVVDGVEGYIYGTLVCPATCPAPTPTPVPTGTPVPTPEAIPWNEALHWVDESMTVCGPVVDVFYSQRVSGSPTFLTLGERYPSADRVTVIIWGADRANFPGPPEELYRDREICVRGRVRMNRDLYEITVRSAWQVLQVK